MTQVVHAKIGQSAYIVSSSTAEKAVDYVAASRVRLHSLNPLYGTVRGTRLYHTTPDSCTCPATTTCSHILALALAYEAGQETERQSHRTPRASDGQSALTDNPFEGL